MVLFFFLLLSTDVGRGSKDDATLAALIRKGDHRAFQLIFDRYHPALYRFLVRYGLSEDSALDILQDVFSGMWEGRVRLDPSRSVRAYLYRSCKNRAANYFRNESRLVHDPQDNLAAPSGTPADEAGLALLQEHLDKAIHNLPERRRAVFELCFIEGLSQKEAAAALSITPKTVENHMGYALKSVRAYLAPYLDKS